MSLVRQIVTTYQRVLVHFLLVILQTGYRQTWLMDPFLYFTAHLSWYIKPDSKSYKFNRTISTSVKNNKYRIFASRPVANPKFKLTSSRCTNRDEAVRNAFPTSAFTEMHKMKLRIRRKVQIKVLSNLITSVWFLKRQIIHNLIKHNREGAVEGRKWSEELSQLF